MKKPEPTSGFFMSGSAPFTQTLPQHLARALMRSPRLNPLAAAMVTWDPPGHEVFAQRVDEAPRHARSIGAPRAAPIHSTR
jgi:hypothetical protein